MARGCETRHTFIGTVRGARNSGRAKQSRCLRYDWACHRVAAMFGRIDLGAGGRLVIWAQRWGGSAPGWVLLLLTLGLVTCGQRQVAAESASTPSSTTAVVQRSPHKVFLWTTQSDVASAHILGSIHLASPDIYPLDGRIEAAFEASTTLVLETDLDEESLSEQMEQFVQEALLPPGQNAYDGLDPELRTRLLRRMEELGLDAARLAGFKLWFITMMVSVGALEQAGYSGEHGIDHHFYRRAQRRNMPVLGLEQVETQLQLLLAMSADARQQDLRNALDADESKRLGVIFEQWQQGLSEALLADIESTAKEYPALYEELFLKRNIVMADGIARLLNQPGHYFIIVGAGHLVGRDNVLQLLTRRGLSVRQR